MSAAADKKVKVALDECRVLMLGAQILFGFHLRAAFEDQFDKLPSLSRILFVFAFFSMTCVIGLLIAPSMQHRMVENGHASGRILAETTRFAGLALLPFALSLGADVFIVVRFEFGILLGAALGAAFLAAALALWYGIEYLWRDPVDKEKAMSEEQDTPIDVRVEQLLTESRVILPGAQALFGFQLVVLLAPGFDKLPEASKLVHLAALCSIALSVILLMAPAAIHRISFGGRNSERFVRIGAVFVIASVIPLAAGMAGDIYVASAKALGAPVGLAVSLAVAAILALLWFVQPLWLRLQRRARGRVATGAV